MATSSQGEEKCSMPGTSWPPALQQLRKPCQSPSSDQPESWPLFALVGQTSPKSKWKKSWPGVLGCTGDRGTHDILCLVIFWWASQICIKSDTKPLPGGQQWKTKTNKQENTLTGLEHGEFKISAAFMPKKSHSNWRQCRQLLLGQETGNWAPDSWHQAQLPSAQMSALDTGHWQPGGEVARPSLALSVMPC